MRALASTGVVLVLLAAGCGSKTSKIDTGRARVLTVAKPRGDGHWTQLLLSPDRRTYLGQWSGECELRVAYLLDADGGKPRAITDYARGSAESVALGWVGRRARVELPRGQPPWLRPGVYLVEPRSMGMTLEHPLPHKRGC
jgi:hypothetical protein